MYHNSIKDLGVGMVRCNEPSCKSNAPAEVLKKLGWLKKEYNGNPSKFWTLQYPTIFEHINENGETTKEVKWLEKYIALRDFRNTFGHIGMLIAMAGRNNIIGWHDESDCDSVHDRDEIVCPYCGSLDVVKLLEKGSVSVDMFDDKEIQETENPECVWFKEEREPVIERYKAWKKEAFEYKKELLDELKTEKKAAGVINAWELKNMFPAELADYESAIATGLPEERKNELLQSVLYI